MKINKRIINVLIVISIMFFSLITYLLYFEIFISDNITTNAYNKRQWEDERKVIRGNIYDSNGIILALTEKDDNGNSIRKYPHDTLYCGIIGYSNEIYGKTQLEMKYDNYLVGKEGINISFGELREGYHLNLTIDNELQKYVYSLLRGRAGAIIVSEPTTGKVLAMVSNPVFDPNAGVLEKNWQDIVERADSPLINRPTQGLYAPGSVYKIVTAAAAFENGKQYDEFEDTGSFDIGGNVVNNYKSTAYGIIDIPKAFAVSSNYVFLKLGFDLKERVVRETASRFGVDKTIDFDIPVNKSTLGYSGKMTDGDSALVSIGQGKLLMTPLHVNMITGAVANGGTMMNPYIVETIVRDSGNLVYRAGHSAYSRPINAETAEYVKELMIKCVSEGTGTKAKINGITVAGKTGTSENELTVNGDDKGHAWFTGFAPAENPQIAVTVVLEYNGGTGGDNAAPIAADVLRKILF